MSGTTVPSRVGDDDARPGSAQAPSAVQPAAAMPSVGERLKTARLAKGLTASDVAKALKLSLRQIDALEADDWASLPCNTIIRGFVRNYARLLGLDGDVLMLELDRLTLPQGAELEVSVGTPVSMPAEGKVDRRDFIRVLSGLIVLALAVAAYYFLPQEWWQSTVSALKSATQSAAVKPVADDNVVTAEAAPAPADAVAASAPSAEAATPASDAALAAAAANPQAAAVATDAAGATAPTAATAAPATAPAAAAPTAAAAPADSAVLKFSFTQPSWVEVRDRSGKVIFSKKNDAGSEREIEGQPPFALVIGNAGYVTLQYKGKPVDLSKRSKEDVARLTVE